MRDSSDSSDAAPRSGGRRGGRRAGRLCEAVEVEVVGDTLGDVVVGVVIGEAVGLFADHYNSDHGCRVVPCHSDYHEMALVVGWCTDNLVNIKA